MLSSHILSEVEKLCDKVGIIRQGKIIESGTLNELRHLTRTNLLVETKLPISSLTEVKGVHAISQKDQALTFQIDANELDEVIKYISQFGVIRLESAPPTLEDLFMQHYSISGQTAHTGAGGVK